jgi:hypothetical protein
MLGKRAERERCGREIAHNPTIHLRVPNADLRQIRSLVPQRYVDLPEAMRALLRKGLAVELGGPSHG